MKKRVFYIFFLIILVNYVSADIIINEIMYNPSGSESTDEWVELYNNGSSDQNISDWLLIDTTTARSLILINGSGNISVGDYAVIIENQTTFLQNYPSFNSTLFEVSSLTLTNSGDVLSLNNTENITEFVNYTDYSPTSITEGKTLERIDFNGGNISSNWQAGVVNGTPGDFNNQIPNLTQNISNFEWQEDIVNNTLNLTQYFSDPDEDDLNWTFISPDNITIIIDNDTNIVNMTPDGNFSGINYVVFIADDGVNVTNSNNVTLNITSVNDAPWINGVISNLTKDEDFSNFVLDLTTYEIDVEDSTTSLDWSISGVNATLFSSSIADIDLDILSFTSVANTSGVDEFTLTLTDSEGGTASQIITLNVTPVNDAPLLSNNINETIWAEDTNNTINLTQFFTDIDNSNLNFSYTLSDNTSISINNDTDIATLTPDGNFSGINYVVFIADDGVNVTNSNNVTLNITSVNDAPFINGTISEVNTTEDDSEVFDLTTYELDVEDSEENLTWSVLSYNTSLTTLSIESSTDNLIIIPVANQSGSDVVNLNLSDSGGLSVTTNITINIIAVNDAPSIPSLISPSNNSNVTSDSVTLQWNESSDPDDSTLIYHILFSDNITNLLFNSSTNSTNTSISNLAENITYYWLVYSDDGKINSSNSSISQFFVSLNNAPLIDSFQPNTTTASVDENSSITFNHTSSDPDNDTLNYTWYVDDISNVITQNFTYSPNFTDSGTHNITLTVKDSNNNTVSNFWNLTVSNVNRVPTFTTINNLTWSEDTVNNSLNLTQHFSDVDIDDTLTYSSTTLNNISIDIDNTTGIVTLTPNTNFNGISNLTFTVFDGTNTNTSNEVSLNITPVNDAPTITNVPDNSTNEDTTPQDKWYNLSLYANDVDEDSLTFSIISQSNSSLINCSVVETEFINCSLPLANSTGNNDINVSVSDGSLSDTDVFRVTVGGVNDNPQIIGTIQTQTFNEDFGTSTLDLTQYESDNEDSTTSLDWSVSITNTSLITASVTDSNSDVITFTSLSNTNGNTTATLTLTDSSGGTDSQTILIVVNKVNDNPTIDTFFPNLTSIKIDESINQIFNITKSDVDGNTLTIQWYKDGTLVDTGDSYKFNGGGSVATFNITILLSDGSLSASNEWSLKTSNKPVADTFDGGTTNFNNISDLNNVSNVILEKSNKGTISFTESINLSEVVDLDSFVVIDNNVVAVDSDILTSLENVKARITMKGQSYTTIPKILFDNGFTTNKNDVSSNCTFCDLVSYTDAPTTNGVVVFDVDHFTTFAVGSSGQSQGINFTDLDTCDNGVIGDLEVNIKEPDDDDEFAPREDIDIEVKVDNDGNKDLDVEVKAILYNKDDEDEEESITSDEEEIEDEDSETFDLTLDLPEDLNENDDYILYVKAYEDGDEDENCNEESIDIDIEREDHDVRIEEVIVNPNIANCGDLVSISVEVQNEGTKDEDDVSVKVSNNILGLNQVSNKFNLEENDDEDSAIKRFTFTIPKNTQEGNYGISAIVDFDDGGDSDSSTLSISECKTTKKSAPVTVVESLGTLSLAKSSFELEQGEAIAIPLLVNNQENIKEEFKIEISDVKGWANPIGSETLTLREGQSSTSYIYLNTKEDALVGKHSFVVSIKSNGRLIDTRDIIVKIDEKTKDISTISFISLIFINILLIIIVVIVVRKFFFRYR
jgi:hypothetical protein